MADFVKFLKRLTRNFTGISITYHSFHVLIQWLKLKYYSLKKEIALEDFDPEKHTKTAMFFHGITKLPSHLKESAVKHKYTREDIASAFTSCFRFLNNARFQRWFSTVSHVSDFAITNPKKSFELIVKAEHTLRRDDFFGLSTLQTDFLLTEPTWMRTFVAWYDFAYGTSFFRTTLGVETTESVLDFGQPVSIYGVARYNSSQMNYELIPYKIFLSTRQIFLDHLQEKLEKSIASLTANLYLCAVLLVSIHQDSLFSWWRKRRAMEERERIGGLLDSLDENHDVSYNEDLSCIICLANPRDVLYQPCWHANICHNCYAERSTETCYTCRGIISKVHYLKFIDNTENEEDGVAEEF